MWIILFANAVLQTKTIILLCTKSLVLFTNGKFYFLQCSLDQAVSKDYDLFVHGALWLTFLVSNLILNQRKYSCMSADDSTYAL